MTGIVVLRLSTLIATLIAIFCIFFFQAALAADGDVKYVWMLTQKHDESGAFVVYVAPQAVRIVSLTNGGIVLAKGPDWKVVCFRPDEKIQWATSLNAFQGLYSVVTGLNATGQAFAAAPPLTKVSSGIVQGITYSSYSDKYHRLFWLADGIKTSPQVAEIICRYFSLPGTRQILLRLGDAHPKSEDDDVTPVLHGNKSQPWAIKNLISYGVDHKGAPKIETTSAKKIAYNAADFEYPKNFKEVHTLGEVVFSQSQKGDLVDFINDLGFTSTTKSKSSK
jgi:hypothetical protein